jgi:hypothetical protein
VTCWNSAAAATNISERGVRPTKTHSDAIPPDLANSLNKLSASLADLGQWEDALAAIEEAAPGLPETGRQEARCLLLAAGTIVATC